MFAVRQEAELRIPRYTKESRPIVWGDSVFSQANSGQVSSGVRRMISCHSRARLYCTERFDFEHVRAPQNRPLTELAPAELIPTESISAESILEGV